MSNDAKKFVNKGVKATTNFIDFWMKHFNVDDEHLDKVVVQIGSHQTVIQTINPITGEIKTPNDVNVAYIGNSGSVKHDIAFKDIMDAYKRQEDLAMILIGAYREEFAKYGGRRRFTSFKDIPKIVDGKKIYEGIESYNVDSSTKTPNDEIGLGSAKRYHKMNVDIQRKVLHELYDKAYKIVKTDKYLLDKFEELDIKSLNHKELVKAIKVSKELVYDIKHIKNWLKEVEHIVKNTKIKINKGKQFKPINIQTHLLTMQELEVIGRAILGRSIEMCPIFTGFLRSSARLYVFNNYIRIIYECPYSVYVHENINNRHAVGEAKFLEKAVQEVLSDISVWVKKDSAGMVDGTYFKLVWDKNEKGDPNDLPNFVEDNQYLALYVDIDRDLKINNT